MSNLDVSPDALRDAGAQLSTASERMQNSNSSVLGGVDAHTSMSTGWFPMGMRAQLALSRHAATAMPQAEVIVRDLWALSSALHILADMYDTADHEAAINFAFRDPGAEAPPGLPAHIDPELAAGAGSTSGAATAYDHSHTSVIPGSPSHRSSSRVVSARYDSEGNLTSTSHHITNPDGSHRYYTEVHPTDPDGRTVITNTMDVGPQPHAGSDQEFFRRLEADTAAQEDPRVQDLLEHGFPDQRDRAADGTPADRPGSVAPTP